MDTNQMQCPKCQEIGTTEVSFDGPMGVSYCRACDLSCTCEKTNEFDWNLFFAIKTTPKKKPFIQSYYN